MLRKLKANGSLNRGPIQAEKYIRKADHSGDQYCDQLKFDIESSEMQETYDTVSNQDNDIIYRQNEIHHSLV